jgi:hypothetical protein
MRTWVKAGLSVVGGSALGLMLSEVAFSAKHGGAFPHLNLYVADSELGARLEPGSSTQICIANNPPTNIRINEEGFRGGSWPSLGTEEIFVAGDSQAFGLGVSEENTVSAELARNLGKTVLNLGVPTYGPSEYRTVIEQIGRKRHPKQVVVVMNLANDLFELSRKNRERHAIWDGWAVRRETAPRQVLEFPGRKWLFQRSHLVFELRRFLASRDPETARLKGSRLPSEGSFRELAQQATEARTEHEASLQKTRQNEAVFQESRSKLEAQLEAAHSEAANRLIDMLGSDAAHKAGFRVPGGYDDGWVDAQTRLATARANPGDIVGQIPYGESTGPYVASARAIRDAAQFRASLEDIAKRRLTLPSDEKAKSALAAVQKTGEVERELDSLLSSSPSRVRAWSPFKGEFEKLKALCDEWGAELIVVILPLDVQVSDSEWKKYGGESVSMRETTLLNDDAVATARALGIKAVSPLAELRAALPGAFLDGDLHLTAKGNRAVAEAIAAAMKEPRALRYPEGGLPPGHKRAPSPANLSLDAVVKGSSAAHCETYYRDGWFRALCSPYKDKRPVGVTWSGSSVLEHHTFLMGETLSLLVPAFPGSRVEGTLLWNDEERSIVLDARSASEAPRWKSACPRPERTRLRPFGNSTELAKLVVARKPHSKIAGRRSRRRGPWSQTPWPQCSTARPKS